MQLNKFWLLLAGSILLMKFVPGINAQEQVYAIWGNPQEGQKVYAQKGCSKCHAINEVGGTLGPDLGKPSRKSMTVSQIAGIMWNHAPEMYKLAEEKGVEWESFKNTEMRDLIAYMYFLRYLDRPGKISSGARLFDEKRCSTCHAIAGEGSKIGPDLSQWKQYQSPILWVEIMWNHAVEMQVKMREMGLKWPKFKDNEIVDLISYIKSQAKEE
ncbi:MAG: c-type cytochrome [Fidelibacterota bacterium]